MNIVAIILAGGKGTRLRPFTISIPKPLLPVGDYSILEVIMHQLAAAGVGRVVVTLGHLGHLFAACIGEGRRFGLQVEYFSENEPLGTAGALRLVTEPGDAFLVMNGDVLTTLDYRKLVEAHYAAKAHATIAVATRALKVGFGVIRADPDGMLAEYQEKPTIPYFVSMGINVLSRTALDFIPPDTKFDMPQLMEALRLNGRRVFCYRSECYWQDIGIFEDYERASADFSSDPTRFLPSLGGWPS